MQRFNNPFQNTNFPGMNFNNQETTNTQTGEMNNNQHCTCGNIGNNGGCGCKKQCPTTYKEVINQYHVTKQPYVHNYHTEIVHHYVTENEFIPQYSCSEVHVNEVLGEQSVVLELRVAPEDMGKVIGKQGKVAKAIRTVVKAASLNVDKKVVVEILDDKS